MQLLYLVPYLDRLGCLTVCGTILNIRYTVGKLSDTASYSVITIVAALLILALTAFAEKRRLSVYWLTRRRCGDGCRGNKSDAANKRRNSLCGQYPSRVFCVKESHRFAIYRQQ